MKQHLHRSLIFWSGILVMAFIAWAWWDSFRHEAYGQIHNATLVNENGGVVAMWWTGGGTALDGGYSKAALYLRPDFAAFQWPCLAHGTGSPTWEDPRPARNATELYPRIAGNSPRGSWLLFIPHWLVLICIAFLWLALLFWRARRRRSASSITA